jgi:hypothetical protein
MPWEYKVVTMPGKRSEQEAELNRLGQEGWEAVCPVGPFFTYSVSTERFGPPTGNPSVELLLKRQTAEHMRFDPCFLT